MTVSEAPGDHADDGDMPADPWRDPSTPAPVAALDDARLLRHALLDLDSVQEILAATAALDEDELRLIALEMALSAARERRIGGS